MCAGSIEGHDAFVCVQPVLHRCVAACRLRPATWLSCITKAIARLISDGQRIPRFDDVTPVAELNHLGIGDNPPPDAAKDLVGDCGDPRRTRRRDPYSFRTRRPSGNRGPDDDTAASPLALRRTAPRWWGSTARPLRLYAGSGRDARPPVFGPFVGPPRGRVPRRIHSGGPCTSHGHQPAAHIEICIGVGWNRQSRHRPFPSKIGRSHVESVGAAAHRPTLAGKARIFSCQRRSAATTRAGPLPAPRFSRNARK